MKVFYFLLMLTLLSFSSCRKQNNAVVPSDSSQNKPADQEFVPIATVQIASSERIGKSLNDQGIDCYAEGSLGFAIYVRKKDATHALNILRTSSDWGVTVWPLDTNK